MGVGAHLSCGWCLNQGVSCKKAVEDFKDGCVVITTDTSMRMVRFHLNRQSLLQALNGEFPSIKKICFKVGPI